MVKGKRFFWLALLSGSLLISAFFWIEQQRREILKIGDSIPVMKYLTRSGLQMLSADSTRVLMLMYFNRNCQHCQYQLDLFERNMDLFQKQRFIFLTSEAKFISTGQEKQWCTLSTQQNCIFGMIPGNEFFNVFGTISTPAIFIFDRRGMLAGKFTGEIKLDKLMQVLAAAD
jgi:thioredoxin-related protein